MTGKVTPCVTMMLCVAGCGSTTSGGMPNSRTLPPPPNVGWTDITEDSLKPNNLPARTERLRAARTARKARLKAAQLAKLTPKPVEKPVTVEVPMDVLRDKPRAETVMATKFEAVPEAHLKPKPPVKVAESKWSYFTPLPDQMIPPAPAPAPAPILTAQAILQPLLAPLPADAVVVPEPIEYPQYVAVGPEYFGLNSDIAPYVLTPARQQPLPQERYALTDPVAIRPDRIAPDVTQVEIAFAPMVPRPRQRPERRDPQQPPVPETLAAAILPPRPDPTPRRLPNDPAPRLPMRTPGDRLVSFELRDDLPDDFAASVKPPPHEDDEPSVVAETTPTFRVRVEPAKPVETTIASLAPATPIETTPLPDLSLVTSDDLANERREPTPDPKPRPAAVVQVAGRLAGVSGQPLQTIASQPANDTAAASGCLVNRGSNDRMILICEGVDISQSHVFRAVVEGESAFRGLRAFDEPEAVISTYGFNSERFAAMSQGPKSARDLAFLRALRKSGKQIRVKGRPFDLYLMKGDNSLATVLVEQVAVSEPLDAVGQ